MIGTRERIAISCVRRIFLIVSGHHDPAFTVASCSTTTTSLPPRRPIVVTTPAPGTAPISWSLPSAFCFVLIVSDQESDLLSERILVVQHLDALRRCQLGLLMLLLDFLRPATETHLRLQFAQLVC